MERDEKFGGAGEESDQLPEEQPSDAVPEDAGGEEDARDEAEDSAGSAEKDPGDATGNPKNAG